MHGYRYNRLLFFIFMVVCLGSEKKQERVCKWCGALIITTDDLTCYVEEGMGRRVYCKYCGTKRL